MYHGLDENMANIDLKLLWFGGKILVQNSSQSRQVFFKEPLFLVPRPHWARETGGTGADNEVLLVVQLFFLLTNPLQGFELTIK